MSVRRKSSSHIVNGQMVEMVDIFKYLHSYTDFYIEEITDRTFKECSRRLHLLRKINNFSVSQYVLKTVC